MAPWSYALLFVVAMMIVALVADLRLARSKPQPIPVRVSSRGRHAADPRRRGH